MSRFFKVLIIIIFSFPILVGAQVYEFDMLEMKYDQEHYRQVHRKSKRLLDDPAYDFSFLPAYYKSISGLRLSQNRWWLRRNSYIFEYAEETFTNMRKTIEGKALLSAHEYELSELKADLKQWLTILKQDDDKTTARKVKRIIEVVFAEVPYVITKEEDKREASPSKVPESELKAISDVRVNIIEHGKKYIGIPYKWAGSDPNGFDCSGFTSYLLEEEAQIKLSRKASEQYENAKKIKRKNVKPGDLVFFDNGSGISHVGIIVNNEGNKLEMIHSSSSIGISIVDIETSAYWKKRLAGFGTYLKD